MRARCVTPRFPPSPTTRQRSSSASTRTASFARSPTSACRSSRAFTYVPMPPFQSRSTGAQSRAWISSLGVSDSASTPSAARASAESGTVFAARGKTPPPGEISAGVVVGPGRAREPEEPLALGEARPRIRVRVEKDVPVVERADRAGCAGEQHPVAEHVAGHVANSDNSEVGGLDVGPELAEVALDRLPGTPRGDRHLLVVVAGRAAGGERVAEPEAVLDRDRVRDVREGRRALVGGDDEVRVVARRGGRRRAAARPCRPLIVSVTSSKPRMNVR